MGRVDCRTCWRRSAGQQQPTIWVRLRCFLDVEHLLDLFRVQNRSQRASDHAGGFHLNKRYWNRSLVILKRMADLHLNLKGEYFDQIKAGTKIFEYRLAAKWEKRLAGKTFERIFITWISKDRRPGTDRRTPVAWLRTPNNCAPTFRRDPDRSPGHSS